jgi:hypothetical protein
MQPASKVSWNNITLLMSIHDREEMRVFAGRKPVCVLCTVRHCLWLSLCVSCTGMCMCVSSYKQHLKTTALGVTYNWVLCILQWAGTIPVPTFT